MTANRRSVAAWAGLDTNGDRLNQARVIVGPEREPLA